MTNYLYVHLDTTNNSIVTKGITHQDFQRYLIHRPKNILLLDPHSEQGQFEPHTGLKVIEGELAVEAYLSSLRKRKENEAVKWVDFSELGMIKQLTPQEIAELLYFGHMKMHLHSPFFYKLQNNFAYFEGNDDLNRVYYRYLEEFYRIFSKKVVSLVLEKVNERKSFFRRSISVTDLTMSDVRRLKSYFLEGVALCFPEGNLEGKEYVIPFYILEDRLQKATPQHFKTTKPVATLTYHMGKKSWHFEATSEDNMLF